MRNVFRVLVKSQDFVPGGVGVDLEQWGHATITDYESQAELRRECTRRYSDRVIETHGSADSRAGEMAWR